MEKFLDLLNKEMFDVSGFAVKLWYIIAVAAVVILLVIIIAVAASKKKKAKASEEKPLFEEETAANEQQKEPVKEQAETVVEEEKIEEVVEEKPVKKTATKKTTKKAVATEEKVEEKEETVTEVEEVKASEEKKEEKPTEKKTTAKKTTAKKVAKGKWKIVYKKNHEYIAELFATNGELMLSSEIYSTPEGAKSGIETIINGVENGNFIIYRDKRGSYYYKLKSANNKLLCAGEIYNSKDSCLSAVESVKRIAKDAVIVEEIVQGEEYIEYVPTLQTANKSAAKGKWKIENGENGFSARLYANNGQLMIATEEVSTKANAEKSMQAVKKNSLDGNFIIDKDKFGRFYYKLRNSQKSVICIGEGYTTLDNCLSALESVRRFAENSDLVVEEPRKAVKAEDGKAKTTDAKKPATKKTPAKTADGEEKKVAKKAPAKKATAGEKKATK